MERKEHGTRRLPEDSVRAGHLQHLLARRFDKPERPAVPWELRVRAQKALSQVAAPVLAAFLRARAVAVDAAAAASLESLARELDASGLSPEVSAQVLDTVALGPVSEAFAEAVRELAVSDVAGPAMGGVSATASLNVLGRLEPRVLKRLMTEIARARLTPWELTGVTALVRSEGFFVLSTKERVELMAYTSGPEVGPAARRAFVNAAWKEQRMALSALASGAAYSRLPGPAQAEMLRDFLYYPTQEVYFLEARVFGGRSVVCFGDPATRPALSYGQVSRFSLAGPFGTRIESPDACVASAFTAKTRDAAVLYRSRRALLSREEVRRTLEWIESSHEIDGREGNGEISRLLAGHRFFAGCFRFVEAFLAGREVEDGLLYFGRPAAAEVSQTDAIAEQLLSEFLAA